MRLIFIVNLMLATTTLPAAAYIGPGAGLGAIAVVLGVIGSVLLAGVALVWYPVKRGFKALRGKPRERQDRD
ncbi:MAG: hypothetical protein ACP5DX_18410 [Paracoccaceae bacterium]